MQIVRRELKVPFELSRAGVERDDAVRVQVVAGAAVAVPIRSGISGAPVDEIEIGIVGAGDPCRRGAPLPAVALPGLVPLLARPGNSPESPCAIARLRVVRIEKPAHAVFTARNADDDLVGERQRRAGDRVARLGIGDGDVPSNLSRLRVERDEMGIERPDVNRVVENGHAAIHLTAASRQRFGHRPPIAPQRPARPRVERDHVAGRHGDVDDAVDDEGRGLEPSGHARLKRPRRPQARNIRCVDGIEPGVTMAEVVARIGQPVARLGIRTLDALVAHLRVQRNRHETGEQEHRDEAGTAGAECAHRVPRNPTRYATT